MSFLLAIIFHLSHWPVHPLAPQWKPGQEYVYQGTVIETDKHSHAPIRREYQLELRILVSRILGHAAEVVCCTRLFEKGLARSEEALSVHLTHAIINEAGHVSFCNAPTGKLTRVDGPATWENGFILPLPTKNNLWETVWESPESGRLPRRFTWTRAAHSPESHQVLGVQESIDWQRPRADSTAWKRYDTLTYKMRTALPVSVERLIVRRAPAHQSITSEIKTCYSLVSLEELQGPRLDERLEDISRIKMLQEAVVQLASLNHDQHTRSAWQQLDQRVQDYQSAPGSTPYRDALITLRTTINAGLENKLSLQQVHHEVSEPVIAVGSLVPHFTLLTPDGATVQLQQFKGKPCLLIFFRPGTELTKTMTQEIPLWLYPKGTSTLPCLFISCVDISSSMLPDFKNTPAREIKVLLGKSIVQTYGASVTPHFMLLDADGALITSLTGWGNETRSTLDKLIRRELAKLK